jgi:hypothetical protein
LIRKLAADSLALYPVQVEVFMLKVRTQANDVALIGSDVNDLILPVEPGHRRITLAASEVRFDRKAKAALGAKIEGKNWVRYQL